MGALGDVSPPEGRRAFAAGAVEGGWQVMQLWDNREDLDAFNREVFLPSIADLGERGFPQGVIVRDVDTVIAWIGAQRI